MLTSVGLFEHFGESKIVKETSYEYFGDIYAGLNPKNPNKISFTENLLKLARD